MRETQADVSTLSLTDVFILFLVKCNQAHFPHYISLDNNNGCVLVETNKRVALSMTRIDPLTKFVLSPFLLDKKMSYLDYFSVPALSF